MKPANTHQWIKYSRQTWASSHFASCCAVNTSYHCHWNIDWPLKLHILRTCYSHILRTYHFLYNFCPIPFNASIYQDKHLAKQTVLRWPCPLPSDRTIPVLWHNLELKVTQNYEHAHTRERNIALVYVNCYVVILIYDEILWQYHR